jgi:hypothetical protein
VQAVSSVARVARDARARVAPRLRGSRGAPAVSFIFCRMKAPTWLGE